MAMTNKFANDCMIELQPSVSVPIWQSKAHLNLSAFEGNSFSFAAVGPSMEAWKPIPPSFTHGFASGPASVGGPKGKLAVFPKLNEQWTPLVFYRAMVGAIIMFAGASGAAMANDHVDHVAVHSDAMHRLTTNLSGEASVRIIALNEEHSRIRFSASGLPAGLSIHPLTGVISGVIDREASRNGGSPFVVKVAVTKGTAASGVSIIGIIVENRLPVLVDDILHVSSKPTQLNVLANDDDLDGDRLVVTDMVASHGAVAFTPTGIVAYAPNPGPLRNDTITYRVDDGHGGSATGKIRVVVK
jgi:Bacterial Ig domain